MTKKTAKATKPKGRPPKEAPPINGADAEQPEANGSSTALVAPRKRGPKPILTQELGDLICKRLASGETLRDICKSAGMPYEQRVREWALEDTPFAEKYRRARELGFQKMADELLEIADDGGLDSNDKRIRVDTRKWILSKMLPKTFGDKIEVENKGGLVIVKLDAEDLAL